MLSTYNATILAPLFLALVMAVLVTSSKRVFTTSMRFGQNVGRLSNSLHPIQSMYESLANLPKHPSPAFYHAINFPLFDKNMAACLDAMNNVRLADLGYEADDINILDESVCGTICNTRQFNIAVFLIPKGHCLPLHDHPSMTVLSKVCATFSPSSLFCSLTDKLTYR
jgi:hypothetical protein